jgi:hypothetical protein
MKIDKKWVRVSNGADQQYVEEGELIVDLYFTNKLVVIVLNRPIVIVVNIQEIINRGVYDHHRRQ